MEERYIHVLKGIVVDRNLNYYLGNIQDEFLMLINNKFFWADTLWKRLILDCGYSLLVVTTDKANQVSHEEKGEDFINCEKERMEHPNQLVFVNESQQKDVKPSRFCRM